MPGSQQDRLAGVRELGGACTFLADLFTVLPDEALMRAMLGADASAFGGPAGEELARWAGEQDGRDVDEVLLDVARDRAVLLRGLREDDIRPPYECLWTGVEANASIAGVNRAYADAGFCPTGEVHDAPDQLGVELAFVAALLDREAGALAAGDVQAADAARRERRRFAADHLDAWAGAYAQAMRARASTGFYRAVSWMVEDSAAQVAQ